MAGGGEKTPANSASQRKERPHHGSGGYGRSWEREKQGASTFSPSARSKDSLQKMVTPVQPPKFVDCRSSLCSAGSVGSDSGAGPLDICMSGNGSFKLKPSLLEINRDKRRATEISKDVTPQHLRPGMVLLKRFIKPKDQVKIVKVCQQLGVGSGGFYRPGYRNGAKLRLWMMCLGKNWDPDSCSYGDARPFDGAQPPTIPEEFRKLVQDAIQASHEFLKQSIGAANAMKELPTMSPDICLVNFYNSSGGLGLHQDKDESKSSLDKGLPVVSFSIGDTTEFLYGDVRDEEKVSKVDLESGDIVIFGEVVRSPDMQQHKHALRFHGDTTEFLYGDVRDEEKVSKVDLESGDILIFVDKPRRSFHGFSNTKPKTAPRWLTDETNLRPGRLTLDIQAGTPCGVLAGDLHGNEISFQKAAA
ncbi:hypothetical protein U9M48_010959 [Paspalum notatum var. saurae]|uniref:Fe2OG dioxygenase domain-containing protein n=1 Tax=Paspalum notatum var. saurae TaxID=547442 RepID=A0AAQ3SU75_PASNO